MATTNPFATPPIKGPAARQAMQALWDRVSGVGALVDGATVTVDISQAVRVFDVVLGGNRILAFTGGAPELDGKQIVLRVWQDATGGRTLTAGAGCQLGADITALTLSAAAGKHDYIGGVYCNASGKVDIIAGPTKGY